MATCAAPCFPQSFSTRQFRRRGPRARRWAARPLAEAWWACPACHAPVGDGCRTGQQCPERAELARRQWWGSRYDEEMKRRGLA